MGDAIKDVQGVLESLPKVANAQQRLLGIRMGADVRVLDGEAGGGGGGEGAQPPDDWAPKTGEHVAVCFASPFRAPSSLAPAATALARS